MKKNLFTLKLAALVFSTVFLVSESSAFTAVTSGNWSSSTTWGGPAPTGTVSNQDIIIPAGFTVTLDVDITFTGLLNSITVDGGLTNTSANGIIITQGSLIGAGTISIDNLSFTSLGNTAFLGNLNLKHLRNSTTSLAFAAIANISDTLDLEDGNLAVNTNGNLTMMSGSVVKVNDGSISLGAGVFNTGNSYSVLYVGNSKTAGIELNTVTLQNAYLYLANNTQSVSLNNNTIVNGDLSLSKGILALNGKKLTLKGNHVQTPGSTIKSTAASELSIEGTGTLTSAFAFDAGSTIGDFSVNRSGANVKLISPLTIAGHLNLIESGLSIENGGLLTMNSASTLQVEKGNLSVNSGTFNGTASYDVNYMGATDITTGVELSGSGLNNLTVQYINSTNKVILNTNTSISNKLDMVKGKLDLNGKVLELNGTISQNINAVFVGSTNSQLDLNLTAVTNDTLFFDTSNDGSLSLNKLRINNAGSTPIVLGTKLIVTNELNFVKGKLELTNGDLVISPIASIVGYSDTRYVVTSETHTGAVVMNVVAGSVYVVFPIGVMNDYSPAYVQQTATATSGNFSARTNTVASLGLKMVNRNWHVASNVAAINANLKFGWVAAAEVNGFDRTNAYISHYTSSMWDISTTGSSTVASNNTYEISRTGLTSLSPFAVVENGQPLAVNEIYEAENNIVVYPNPANDVLHIKSLNTTDTYVCVLSDITGRVIKSIPNFTNTTELFVSDLESGSYFVTLTNLSQNTNTTKRFIKN